MTLIHHDSSLLVYSFPSVMKVLVCQSAQDSGGEDSGASLKISKEIVDVMDHQFVEPPAAVASERN